MGGTIPPLLPIASFKTQNCNIPLTKFYKIKKITEYGDIPSSLDIHFESSNISTNTKLLTISFENVAAIISNIGRSFYI